MRNIKWDQLEIVFFIYGLYMSDNSDEIDCKVRKTLEEIKKFVDVVKPDKSSFYSEMIEFCSDKNTEIRKYLISTGCGIL